MRTLALAIVLFLGTAANAQTLTHELAERGGSVSVNLDLPIAGLPLVIDVEFSFSVDAASVHLRPMATGGAYSEVVGSRVGGSDMLYRATVDGALISSRGVEFYLSYVEDGVLFTLPASNPEAFPLRYPVLTARIRADVNLAPLRYRMISIPFQFVEGVGPQVGSGTLASIFADDFGSYNPRRWRVLRWNSLSESYVEGTAAVPKVEPGEAFWLITSSGGDFDVEGGVTPGFEIVNQAAQQVPVSVTASPGWTQVGNPFLYPIDWDQVEGAQSLEEPVGYTASGYVPGQTTLAPWTGYFVYNPGSAPVDLRFHTPDGATAARAPVSYVQTLLEGLPAGSFVVQISAVSGSFEDGHTYLVGSDADVAARKPPSMDDSPRVAIIGADGGYMVKSVATTTGPWLIEVESSPEGAPVTVRMLAHGSLPPESAIRIREAETGEQVHAPGGTFDLVGSGGAQRFIVDVTARADMEAPPLGERLAQPFPNPAIASQALGTYLWSDGDTRLELFDILGRHIRSVAIPSLESGWQSAQVDLKDSHGRPLPAGLYVLRLISSSGTASRTFTIIR